MVGAVAHVEQMLPGFPGYTIGIGHQQIQRVFAHLFSKIGDCASIWIRAAGFMFRYRRSNLCCIQSQMIIINKG